jgi:hypothetical protein
MQRYIISLTKTYEVEVEADTSDEAEAKALDLPLSAWSDPYEPQVETESALDLPFSE